MVKSGHDFVMDRGKGKIIHARVMVLVLGTTSECALQMYEVSLKYL